MKKYLLVFAILFAGIVSAQSLQEVENFNRVKIDVDAQVEIMFSPKNEVMMSLPATVTKNIKVTSKNGALVITNTSASKLQNLRIRIYTNSLKALSVSKGADVDLKNFGYCKSLVVQTSGNSSVNTNDMKIEDLNIMRTSDSKVIAKNATNIKESVDNVAVAAR
ncbi:MAG: DUF2807 domain-containing protein [Nonlabens sp.]